MKNFPCTNNLFKDIPISTLTNCWTHPRDKLTQKRIDPPRQTLANKEWITLYQQIYYPATHNPKCDISIKYISIIQSNSYLHLHNCNMSLNVNLLQTKTRGQKQGNKNKAKQKSYNAAMCFQRDSQPSDLRLRPSYPIFQAHYEQSPPSLMMIISKTIPK